MREKIFILWLVINIIFPPAYSAWWDETSLPLPADTQEEKIEDKSISDSEFRVIHYVSRQDASSLKDFYRLKLPLLGWKLGGLIDDAEDSEKLKLDLSSIKNILDEQLIFEKGEELLMINFFVPEKLSPRDGKTHFALSMGRINSKAAGQEEEKGKENLPVYPGAATLNHSGQKESSLERVAYSTKDGIEQVVSFYKLKMPDYGWSLVKEEPVSEEIVPYPADFECPSCPGQIDKAALAMPVEMKRAKLIFSHRQLDTCSIVFSNARSGGGAAASGITTISVHYEKNN